MNRLSKEAEARLRDRIYRACLPHRSAASKAAALEQRVTALTEANQKVDAPHGGTVMALDVGLKHWGYDGLMRPSGRLNGQDRR